jgi:hypothetical protein
MSDMISKIAIVGVLRDWQDDLNTHRLPETAITVGMAADIVGKFVPEQNMLDPTVVHMNMLRGTIAKPTVEQIIHLYGVDALVKALSPVIVREAEVEHDEYERKVEQMKGDFPNGI